MKKILITKLIILVTLLFLVCGIASAFFMGKKMNFRFFNYNGSSKNELIFEEKYSNVKNIDVNLVEEEIVVYEHNSNDIIIKYYGNPDRTPRAIINGNELKIERKDEWYFNLFNFGYSGRIEIYMPSNQIDKLDLSNVSGNVDVEPSVNQLQIDTISGNIDVTNSGYEANLNTVSGNIRTYGGFDEVDAETVSGNIRLTTKEDAKIDANTVSGSVRCNLYDSSVGYTVDFDTVSGQFKDLYNDQKFSGEVKTNFGNNELRFNVETVSGSFKIEEWD